MSQYPGVLRVSANYIKDTTIFSAQYAVGLGILCSPMLITGWITDGIYRLHTLFVFIGMFTYLSQLKIGGELTDLEEEHKAVRVIVNIMMVIYYNLVLFWGLVLSLAIARGINPTAGLSSALVYCAYDLEMSKIPYPTSIAGIIVSCIAILAWAGEALQKIRGAADDLEVLESIRDLNDSPDVMARNFLFLFRRRLHQ